ncbi:hypothetical protein M0657_004168 [Pyricularia oryzae]|nr:hypothetical protein M0657_004168 [Pyricularia oryzae]KAI7925621.1 hypothetical protein M9X92_003182 [Pyricularia oryzae]
MARPRIPSRFAIALLAIRGVASILTTLTIIFLLYMTIMLDKTFTWSYTAAVFALILDTAEAATIADRQRTVPRMHWGAVAILEVLVLGLCIGGCLTLALGDLADGLQEDGTYFADPYRMYALACQAAVAGLHFCLSVMGCVERSRRRIEELEGEIVDSRAQLAQAKNSLVTVAVRAEVIKIEHPVRGDDTRAWGPPYAAYKPDSPLAGTSPGESAYYLTVNRNKKSIGLSFQDPAGVEILHKLMAKCDILVENYLPGALKKYKLDYATAAKINPSLIYASITGYGQTGPYSDRAGYDVMVEAEFGLMHITGTRDGPPVKVGVAVTDLTTGLYTSNSIMAALLARQKSGRGQHLDVALSDCQTATLANIASSCLISGKKDTGRWGTAHPSIVPYRAFQTRDSAVLLGGGNDRLFAVLCDRIGRPDLKTNERYTTNALRVQHRDELEEQIEAVTRSRTTQEWLDVLAGCGMPYAAVNDVQGALNHEHTIARDMVVEVEHPSCGTVKMVNTPVKYSESTPGIRTAPPTLGQHTNEVLGELLGMDGEQIEGLREKGVVVGCCLLARPVHAFWQAPAKMAEPHDPPTEMAIEGPPSLDAITNPSPATNWDNSTAPSPALTAPNMAGENASPTAQLSLLSSTPNMTSTSQQLPRTGTPGPPAVPGGGTAESATSVNPPTSPGPRYQQQFSAATQMILNRIRGQSTGGTSSAITSAAASMTPGVIQPSTFADARRRLMDSMSTTTMQIPASTVTAATGPTQSTAAMNASASTASASVSAPRLPGQNEESARFDVLPDAVNPAARFPSTPSARTTGTNKSKAASSKSAIVKVNAGYAPGRHVSKAAAAAKASKASSAPSTPAPGGSTTGGDKPATLKRGPGRPPGSGKPKPPPSGRGPGRPPGSGKGKGTAASSSSKRKRSVRDDAGRDGSLSSDISDTESPRVASTAAAISPAASTPLTTTKSGRQIQKPETYNPVQMDLVSSASTRRTYQTPESKTAATPCKACGRIADTKTNLIVFCDGCNYAWHQNCHTPNIDDSFINEMAKAWHCVGCATKAGEKKDGKKASKAAAPAVVAEQAVAVAAAAAPASTSNPSSETKGTGKVSWIKRTSGQKRAYLSSLSHADLVELVIHCTNLHPNLPIFPSDDTGSAVGIPTGLLTAASSASGPGPRTAMPTSTGRNPAAVISSSARPSDEGIWEDLPGNYNAWKRPDANGAPTTRIGATLKELEAMANAHLEDPDDHESFSHTVYDDTGRAVEENGVLLQLQNHASGAPISVAGGGIRASGDSRRKAQGSTGVQSREPPYTTQRGNSAHASAPPEIDVDEDYEEENQDRQPEELSYAYVVQTGGSRGTRPLGPDDRSAEARAWDNNASEWGSFGLGRAALMGVTTKLRPRKKPASSWAGFLFRVGLHMRAERCSDAPSAQGCRAEQQAPNRDLTWYHTISSAPISSDDVPQTPSITTTTNAPVPAFGPAAESCPAWNRLDGSRILEVGGQALFAV